MGAANSLGEANGKGGHQLRVARRGEGEVCFPKISQNLNDNSINKEL